jgi:hypothetical protein
MGAFYQFCVFVASGLDWPTANKAPEHFPDDKIRPFYHAKKEKPATSAGLSTSLLFFFVASRLNRPGLPC